MPVRFRCHGCQRVLCALDRKIGTEVNCPGCGAILVVPKTDTVPAPPRPDVLQATLAAGPAADSPTGPPRPLVLPATVNDVPTRRRTYIKVLLLVLATAGALVAGYYVGTSGDGSAEPNQGTLTIRVDGQVIIRSAEGHSRPDAGAAVLILPFERPPRRDSKIEADALSPRRPLPAVGDAALATIDNIGGAYARTDDEGRYRVTLAEPGKYHILILSAALERDTRLPERVDLAALGEYVYDAVTLIANAEYLLSTRDLTADARFDHEFRE